jgi:asparagine synthase (glutamine-hydrolysing)
MCGIAGYLTQVVGINLPGALRGMADAIAHRGPDDEGFFESGTSDGKYRLGLAHRRLSIIDLSAGHQPMGNEDGSIQIVFNGEIYNFQTLREELRGHGHVFATGSDTETIVHAYEQWDTGCVDHFSGMFAFAIWDSRKQRLFLARDRFGKKPLYLRQTGDTLLFASEVKALLRFPGVEARVDPAALWDYFANRYVSAPTTLFAGISKLMPGSWALWDNGHLTERVYYHPPDGIARQRTVLPDDPVGEFLQALDRAVEKRMVADVPFGAFLSGGLDSSAVVGLMAKHSNIPVRTFSVGFEESDYSELAYARTIATQFGTAHHELNVSHAHILENLPNLIRFRDAPVAEPSDIPIFLLAREASRTVKMVLTGEGADEFLGGYPKHVYEPYSGVYQSLPGFLRHKVLEPFVQSLPFAARRIKTAISSLAIEQHQERMSRWFGAMSSAERVALIAMAQPQSTAPQNGTASGIAAGNSALRRILYFDQTSWLPDNLLERGDSMTMAASIEARMPFMDHELAALVSRLPDDWRIRRGTTKYILRQAMKRVLPAHILDRPKVGLRVPVNEWLRGGMKDYLHDHLLGNDSKTRTYFHRSKLEQLMAEHANGRQNHEKLLWALLSLEIWHREYV